MPSDGATMRDTSVDYETGWLFDGFYGRKAPDLSTGVGGLGYGHSRRRRIQYSGRHLLLGGFGEDAGDGTQIDLSNIPAEGRQYIREALRDPQARPILEKLLTSSASDPSNVLAAQVEADLAETLHPTGKVVVFKSLVGKIAPRLRAAEDALVRATDPRTKEGAVARNLKINAGEGAAQDYLHILAFSKVAPHAVIDMPQEAPPDDLSGLGRSLLKKAKETIKEVARKTPIGAVVHKIETDPKAKKLAVGAAVGAAVIAAGVITGGAILPALGTAATLATKVSTSTMKKPAAPAPAAAGAPSPVWDPVSGQYITPTTTDTSASGGTADQYTTSPLTTPGGQSVLPGVAPSGVTAPATASFIDPDTVKYGLIAVAGVGLVYALSFAFRRSGGSSKGRRR